MCVRSISRKCRDLDALGKMPDLNPAKVSAACQEKNAKDLQKAEILKHRDGERLPFVAQIVFPKT